MAALGAQEWQEHATLVGHVTLSWNRTVHQLLRIFVHLTGIESPLAEAIFFSPRSDSAQRRLIREVAKAVELNDDSLKDLEKIFRKLDKASTGRNLAAHMIFGITMFDPETGAWGAKVVPALPTTQDPRLAADFAEQFRMVDEQLSGIYQDLESWLLHAPIPDRSWGTPPYPKYAAAKLQALLEGDGTADDGQSIMSKD